MTLKTFLIVLIIGLSTVTIKYSSLSDYNYVKAVVPDELTVENVYRELRLRSVEHPDIVLRQAIQETGWFKCKSCSMRYNNIFGFRTSKGYLKFKHWKESIAYYKRWQCKHYNGSMDYYRFLTKIGYSEESSYTSKLKRLKVYEDKISLEF